LRSLPAAQCSRLRRSTVSGQEQGPSDTPSQQWEVAPARTRPPEHQQAMEARPRMQCSPILRASVASNLASTSISAEPAMGGGVVQKRHGKLQLLASDQRQRNGSMLLLRCATGQRQAWQVLLCIFAYEAMVTTNTWSMHGHRML